MGQNLVEPSGVCQYTTDELKQHLIEKMQALSKRYQEEFNTGIEVSNELVLIDMQEAFDNNSTSESAAISVMKLVQDTNFELLDNLVELCEVEIGPTFSKLLKEKVDTFKIDIKNEVNVLIAN